MNDDDRKFRERFEAGKVPLTGFTHEAHVRLAWIYLNENPMPEAMIHFRDSLKRFAALHGKSELYHETITFAFILIIHDRMQRQGAGASWAEFAQSNPDVLLEGRALLVRIYSEETLASAHAKRTFCLPFSDKK